MPLRKARKGSSKRAKQKVASANIREFRKGSTFARTRKKYGKARAQKQAVAVALKSAGLSRKRKKR